MESVEFGERHFEFHALDETTSSPRRRLATADVQQTALSIRHVPAANAAQITYTYLLRTVRGDSGFVEIG